MAAEDYLTVAYAVMQPTGEADSMGGTLKRYREKSRFWGGPVLKQTVTTRQAGQNSAKDTYVLMTAGMAELERGWLIRRIEDGAFFRVAAPSRERKTPVRARNQLSMAVLERVEL